jgi:mannose-1-phosphate guanylyltransferase
MLRDREFKESHWCIVVADDRAPEWVAHRSLEHRPAPVQYGCLGGSATLLQLALRRAASIAPNSQILVTALEEYRDRWEPILWSVRPEMRFVSNRCTNPLLASATAILSISRVSPSRLVTILPARCYVGHELILRHALRLVAFELPHVPEGVVTLGMVDLDEGVDEDYIVVRRSGIGRSLAVDGIARRPTAWVARHLRRQGALVSSGIMIGYAGVFAAHIAKSWSAISGELTALGATASAAKSECEIPNELQHHMPASVLKSLRWHPPTFPQLVFPVFECGWSSLKSQYAVARIAEFVANRASGRQPSVIRPANLNHSETTAL